MFEIYLKSIEIESVRNLHNIKIEVSAEERKNIIITGKNGTGKTSLLNAMVDNLNYLIKNDDYSESEDAKSGVSLSFNVPLNGIKSHFDSSEFVVASYRANRNFAAIIPSHVENVVLKDRYDLYDSPRTEFVKYLLDLKMKEALSRTSGKNYVADTIHSWFEKFDGLLKTIFEDETTKLDFDEETFQFSILQDNKKPFGFNALSDGYAAVLDIVVDIMLRMEKYNNRSFIFEMPGIVLIDEIETHLHIELQKSVMNILTTIFPNVQFIVTTHSPFVINCTENAVIFDLENKTLVKDGLTNVTYEGVVEGYFKVDSLSKELRDKFEEYKRLTIKKDISDKDINAIIHLEHYLDEIPDYLAPELTAEYSKLKLEFNSRSDLQ